MHERGAIYDDLVDMHDKVFPAHFYYKKVLMWIKPQSLDDQVDDAKKWMWWRQHVEHAMVIIVADTEGKDI
jgi:hypothetical protein